MAGLFALICFGLQAWRLFSLSATYDQALFLQELWATAGGRPFESSLSSVLSGAVVVGDGLPSIDYLHLGQHANVLTVLMAPLVAVFGMWALPLLQVGLLAGAGLVLWRLADARVPRPLAERITLAYFLSGAVIGPALENFHDLVWLPLLAFLVVGGLLDGCRWRVCLFSALLLLVREDSGLLLFSLGLWALVRRPDQRITGALLMLVSSPGSCWSPVGSSRWWTPRCRIASSRRSSVIWWMTRRGERLLCFGPCCASLWRCSKRWCRRRGQPSASCWP